MMGPVIALPTFQSGSARDACTCPGEQRSWVNLVPYAATRTGPTDGSGVSLRIMRLTWTRRLRPSFRSPALALLPRQKSPRNGRAVQRHEVAQRIERAIGPACSREFRDTPACLLHERTRACHVCLVYPLFRGRRSQGEKALSLAGKLSGRVAPRMAPSDRFLIRVSVSPAR